MEKMNFMQEILNVLDEETKIQSVVSVLVKENELSKGNKVDICWYNSSIIGTPLISKIGISIMDDMIPFEVLVPRVICWDTRDVTLDSLMEDGSDYTDSYHFGYWFESTDKVKDVLVRFTRYLIRELN